MSFETIERLKQEYTDKYVVVDAHTPELKRFVGLTGTVKTINMNGRALVQFDGAVDISWYDIDLAYLTVVDQPVKKQPVAAHAAAGEKTEKKAAAPAAKAPGKSPLELAREQAAAKAGGAPAAPAADKPLSKLEQARAQAAAAKGGAAPAAPLPKPAAAPSNGDKPLSKIELARQQAAAKKAAEAAPAEVSPSLAATGEGVVEESAPAPAAPAPAPKPADTSGLSKIELARRQGAFKG